MTGTGSRILRGTQVPGPGWPGSSALARGRTTRRALLTAFSTLTLLTACGTGQRAQTASEIPVVDGIAAQIGSLAIRDAGISPPLQSGNYPSGSDAALQLVIVNSGRVDDQLVSVTSSAANAASLSPGGSALSPGSATAAAGPSGTPGAAESDSSGGSSTTTTPPANGTTGAAGSASAGAISPGAASPGSPTRLSEPIPLPAGEAVRIGYAVSADPAGPAGSPAVLLTGLKADLYPAQSIPVVFTFASGAVLTASLGVKLTAGSNSSAPTIGVQPSAVS